MVKDKAERFLDDYQRRGIVKPGHDQSAFFLALCHVQLGNYAEARRLFDESILAMLRFGMRALWALSAQPHWLVDVYVLSGRMDLYSNVIRELEQYKLGKLGGSYVALYSYALMELLSPTGQNFSTWVKGLLEKPKIKDGYAIGLSIQAILSYEESALHNSLSALLEVHEGQATHGGLRETAEGLLCMPAMSLAYVALERNMQVVIENDYLSLGYLNYLRTEAPLRH